MKKLITLSIAILLSISSFATNYPSKDTPFSKVVFGKNGMVTKDKELIQTKLLLVGAGLGMFTTGLILHQREMNSSHKFEGPGIGVGPNQLLQIVGVGTVCIGVVIRF